MAIQVCCEKCNKEFKSKQALKRHKCDTCRFMYDSGTDPQNEVMSTLRESEINSNINEESKKIEFSFNFNTNTPQNVMVYMPTNMTINLNE